MRWSCKRCREKLRVQFHGRHSCWGVRFTYFIIRVKEERLSLPGLPSTFILPRPSSGFWYRLSSIRGPHCPSGLLRVALWSRLRTPSSHPRQALSV